MSFLGGRPRAEGDRGAMALAGLVGPADADPLTRLRPGEQGVQPISGGDRGAVQGGDRSGVMAECP